MPKAHSCVIVWAAPQAPEKIVKIERKVIRISLRPRISLNFAEIIKNPIHDVKEMSNVMATIKIYQLLTCIGDEICGDDPSTVDESLQVIGDR